MLKCKQRRRGLVVSDGKTFHPYTSTSNNEGATSNSREFNSGNKQIIGGGRPESLSKRDVGDGSELPKILRSITMQRPVSLTLNTILSSTRNQWRLTDEHSTVV